MTVSNLLDVWLDRTDKRAQRALIVDLYALLTAGQKAAAVTRLKAEVRAILDAENAGIDAQIADVNATTA